VKGDACKLDQSLGKFDIIFAGNIIDRLYDPEAFLRGVVNFLNPQGLIVLTSSYTWLEEFTPKDKWLGGKQAEDVTGSERIQKIFTELGLK
jgi:2-polyprenyl-3-methyl-5-hydroxy-6-metoxy-1,4-benzoquinol methylase